MEDLPKSTSPLASPRGHFARPPVDNQTMHLTRTLMAGLALGTVAATAPLQSSTTRSADRLPTPELESFRQTEATSFEDYAGRAVLIEFFEYW